MGRGIFLEQSSIFARVLFSRNFADAKFCENITRMNCCFIIYPVVL